MSINICLNVLLFALFFCDQAVVGDVHITLSDNSSYYSVFKVLKGFLKNISYQIVNHSPATQADYI